jgi:hypothetical protein
MAGNPVPFLDFLQLRSTLKANTSTILASRMETASRRNIDRAWNIPLKKNCFFFLERIGNRSCRDQSLGVRMKRVTVKGMISSQFHNAA